MDNFSSHPLYKKHNLDTVLNSLVTFYARNFLVLFFASFIMSLCTQFLTLTMDFSKLADYTDPRAVLESLRGMILPMLAISLISLLFITILHYYVIYNPLDNSISIFVAVYKSLKYFLPYLVIMIIFIFLSSFVLFLGLLAFFIGIFFAIAYVATLYFFILPILMVEGPNIGNAINRTFILAHRKFWSNMGWVAIFLIFLILISLILTTIIYIPFAGRSLNALTNPEEGFNALAFMTSPVYLILSSLISALYLPLMPIFATILYFNGKAREEDTTLSGSSGNEPPEKISVQDLYGGPGQDNQPEK